jgi:peptidoglycan/LPS O-acetylase OafA/YrhL
MVLITGVLVGVIFIALRGKSSGLKRFYALGGLAILMGIVLAYSNLPQVHTLSLFYGLLGIAILISGGLVLRSYLQENPPSSENDHE